MYQDNLTAEQIKDFQILGKDIESYHEELYAGIHRDAMALRPARFKQELEALSIEEQNAFLDKAEVDLAKAKETK